MTRGTSLEAVGRTYEGQALLRAGIELAESGGAIEDALMGRVLLVISLSFRDVARAYEMGRAGLAEARRLGERSRTVAFLGNVAEMARWIGDWDWALGELALFLDGDLDPEDRLWLMEADVVLRSWRGEEAADRIAELRAAYDTRPQDIWSDVSWADVEAHRGLADGRLAEARAAAHELARLSPLNSPTAYHVAARAALWGRDAAGVRDDLAGIEATGVRGPLVTLRRMVYSAGLAALEGRLQDARSRFVEARRELIDRGVDFEAALVAIDMATVLGRDDPDVLAAAADARPILERLRARPFLERLEAALGHTGRPAVEAAQQPPRG
jgi:hypothetical protein